MRLIAHEREKGTLVLVNTAPVKDREIVFGKFLALFPSSVVTILTGYMPALIFVTGASRSDQFGRVLGFSFSGRRRFHRVFASAFRRTQVSRPSSARRSSGDAAALDGGEGSGPPVNNFILSMAIHHERRGAS